MRTYSFEWTPVLQDTQGRSLCISLEITARTGAEVQSMVAISSVGGVSLELMAPVRGSRIPLCGWCGCRHLCGSRIPLCGWCGCRHLCGSSIPLCGWCGCRYLCGSHIPLRGWRGCRFLCGSRSGTTRTDVNQASNSTLS
ncbi:unnamed protein product, partial [Staurois parvus]